MDQEECFYDSLDEEQFNKEVKQEEQRRKKVHSRIPVLVGSTIGPYCRGNTSLSLRSNNSSIHDVKSNASKKSNKSNTRSQKNVVVPATNKSSVIPLKLVMDVQNDLWERELKQKKRTYLEMLKQRMKDSSYNSCYSRRRYGAGQTSASGRGAAAGQDADSQSLISNCNSLSSRCYPSTIYSTFSDAGPEYDTASMYENYKIYPASNMFEFKKVESKPLPKVEEDADDENEEEEIKNKANVSKNRKPEIKELMPARCKTIIPEKSESLYIEKCSESHSLTQLENIMNDLKSVSEVCVMIPGKPYRAYKKDEYEALKNMQVSGGLGADMLSPDRLQKLEKMKKMTEYGMKASIRNRAKIIAKIRVKEE